MMRRLMRFSIALGLLLTTVSVGSQSLLFTFADISLPAAASPFATARDNPNQLEVLTPSVATLPEPSSMVLLGSGLLLVARFVRRVRV